MIPRRFQDKDYDRIIQWLDDRKIPRFKREYLPKRGWIVDDVAAAFLFKGDCKIGFIDFFATNPNISQEVRLQACDLLIRIIEKEAVKIGLTALVGYSKILRVQAMGVRSGFKYDPEPYFMVFKNLGDSTHARRDESKPTGPDPADSARWQVV